MKRSRNGRTVKWLAFGCVHAPLHDQEAIDWLCKQIEDVKPDFIIDCGDAFEAKSASKFPDEYQFTLMDEYVANEKIRLQIKDASPESKKIHIMGNHDHNLVAMCPKRIPKDFRGLTDYRVPQYNDKNVCVNREFITSWDMSTEYIQCRKRGLFRLGEVVFGHGWGCNAASGANEAVWAANEWGLYVRSHTHRPTNGIQRAMKTQAVPLRYWYANTGTMRDMWDVEYMRRNSRSMWGCGIVCGESQLIKSPRRHKTWTAETRLFRMFTDIDE